MIEAAPPAATPPEATPPATPPAEPSGTPPATPPATPASSEESEKVTLTKEEHDQLQKDAARASSAQSKADRFESVLKKNNLMPGSGHFKPAAPATPPSQEESEAEGAAEDRKAERGLIALALDPAHRQVLDADPTLREMLTKNPLSVLPILAPDALDADDAVALVKEALASKQANIPPVNPPGTPPGETPPATPPPGAVNPQDIAVNEEVEAARKLPNTENAIAGMIKAKSKAEGTK